MFAKGSTALDGFTRRSVLRRLAVLGHITGVDDGVGLGIEAVDIGNARTKVFRPRAEHRVRRIGVAKVSVGDLGDDHGGALVTVT